MNVAVDVMPNKEDIHPKQRELDVFFTIRIAAE